MSQFNRWLLCLKILVPVNPANNQKRFFKRFTKLNLLTLVLASPLTMAFDYGDPSSFEQAHLEMINRARLDPLKEASRLQINLNEGVTTGSIQSTPMQPLSSNSLLLGIARAHSADMLKQNYFAHNNLAGKSPFDRMSAANYVYQTAGENLGLQGISGTFDQATTAQVTATLHDSLFIDSGVADRGHRKNILNPSFKEIGVGLGLGSYAFSGTVFNSAMITNDSGTRNSNIPIILGVVYEDKNGDFFYNAGEGLNNFTIALSNATNTRTASAGGYGVEVSPNGTYTLTFTHPSYGSISKSVQVGTLNVKVDVLSSEFKIGPTKSITGLYVTYFNRAPDKSGLTYWQNQASTNGDTAALFAISSAFAQNAVAMTNYPTTMTTADFVKQMYNYALGRLADTNGQAYWESRVAAVGRSNTMVEFINAVLSYDATTDTTSTAAEKQVALDAQAMINHKITAGVFFASSLYGPDTKSNVPLDANGDPSINSAAYLASQEVLKDITKDSATLDAAILKAKNYKISLP